MFTGIIQAVGEIARLDKAPQHARVVINTNTLPMQDVSLGDSISVNGVCLTAIELSKNSFAADVSAETLVRTTLGELAVGSQVNLEKALRLNDFLGGHLVSGHVDGVGRVLAKQAVGDAWRYSFEAPQSLMKYIAEKGSITINGISLTVNDVATNQFQVMIVPHTLQKTMLGTLAVGGQVNLEVDIIARYLERLLTQQNTQHADGLSYQTLMQHGFIKPDR